MPLTTKNKSHSTLNLEGLAGHTFNPRTWEEESGKSLSWGHLGLQSEFQYSQNYRETLSQNKHKQNPKTQPQQQHSPKSQKGLGWEETKPYIYTI